MRVIFIPECYADTALIDFFLRDKSKRLHQRAISKVASAMQSETSSYIRKIGVIDNDKNQPPFFKKFTEIKNSDNFSILHKPDTELYLIKLKPALEVFLINLCKEIGKQLSDFDLPNNLKQLTDITKDPSIANNPKFKRLLNELRETPTFQELKQFLSELQSV